MTIAHFYTAALSFFLGVGMASLFTLSLYFIFWLGFLALVFALLWRRDGLSVWLMCALGCFMIVLGALRVEVQLATFGQSPLKEKVGQTVTITGVVDSEPDVRASLQYLEVKTDTDTVLVSLDRHESIRYGDVLEVTGVLKEPETFITDFGREFDYKKYLRVRGIEYTISFAEVATIARGEGNYVVSELLTFKQYFLQQVAEVVPEPAAGLGAGLLLGVKQALGEELEMAFRKTGIIHVVVLSGYNVMLVVAFVLFVLGRFLAPRLKIIFGIVAICLFALLVGLSATVVRASIMAALLLVVQATGRTYVVLRGLLLAGLVMVMLNPLLLIYDIGFQLSFMATLGLILIAPHIDEWCSRLPNFLGMRMFLSATVATQVAVLPLLLFHIGELSVVSVVVNMLVLPMVPVAMLLTFMVGMVGFVMPSIAVLVAHLATASLLYIVSIAQWFATLPFAAYVVPTFPVAFVPVLYAGLGFLLWQYRNHATTDGVGELGESLLTVVPRQSDVSDWVIEEESETKTTPRAEVVLSQK